MLTIQAIFAREFPTAECANVLLEPCCQAAIGELLTLQACKCDIGYGNQKDTDRPKARENEREGTEGLEW